MITPIRGRKPTYTLKTYSLQNYKLKDDNPDKGTETMVEFDNPQDFYNC